MCNNINLIWAKFLFNVLFKSTKNNLVISNSRTKAYRMLVVSLTHLQYILFEKIKNYNRYLNPKFFCSRLFKQISTIAIQTQLLN